MSKTVETTYRSFFPSYTQGIPIRYAGEIRSVRGLEFRHSEEDGDTSYTLYARTCPINADEETRNNENGFDWAFLHSAEYDLSLINQIRWFMAYTVTDREHRRELAEWLDSQLLAVRSRVEEYRESVNKHKGGEQ